MESYEILQAKKEAFLKAFAKTANITTAAKAAKIARQTHYDWLANDDEAGTYAKAFKDAQDEAIDLMEEEARHRAVDGWDEPVYYQGEKVGKVRKRSDTLLMFMLKGARPEKYKDRVQAELTGKDGGPIEHKHKVDLSALSDEELDALDRIVSKATPDAPADPSGA